MLENAQCTVEAKTDGSYLGSLSESGEGSILRNETGEFLYAFCVVWTAN